jgi:hypothetical protein
LPGVFTQNQTGSGPGAILELKPNGSEPLNTAANPASAGEALIHLLHGSGDGEPASCRGIGGAHRHPFLYGQQSDGEGGRYRCPSPVRRTSARLRWTLSSECNRALRHRCR